MSGTVVVRQVSHTSLPTEIDRRVVGKGARKMAREVTKEAAMEVARKIWEALLD